MPTIEEQLDATMEDRVSYTYRLRPATVERMERIHEELSERGKRVSKSDLVDLFMTNGMDQYDSERGKR